MPYRFRFPTAIYSLIFLIAVYTVACSAQAGDASLDTLRKLTKDGKLPAESVVAGIETRYAGKKTGALAKLLRARIIKHTSGPLNAKGTDVAMEELVVAYERLEME